MTENTEKKGSGQLSALWALNIILLAGLGVMFYLHFSKADQAQPQVIYQPSETAQTTGPRIAFVDSDVLMEQYEMVPEMIKRFEASTREKEAVIRERQKEFEQKVSEFQQRIQSGTISMEIAQITEQQLMREQQELLELRDELSEQLAREEFTMNIELFEVVSQFLEQYNRTRQFDLIFNHKQGSSIFIANQAFDITPEVVELLNHEYRLRRPRR